jgi:hypothetical protein
MTTDLVYPVLGRSESFNCRLAGHEAGHALVGRSVGTKIWCVTIIPNGGYEGMCRRSGPITELTFDENSPDKTDEIVDTCARLERLTPILGSNRVESSEYYIRSQNNCIELVAGECAELVLHPDLASLGATHDFVEADSFARIAVAAQPAVAALIAYCRAEATALLTENRDILDALVEALIEAGELSGERVDEIISDCVTRRSAETERQRRDDWKERETSAAQFLKGLKSAPSDPGFDTLATEHGDNRSLKTVVISMPSGRLIRNLSQE